MSLKVERCIDSLTAAVNEIAENRLETVASASLQGGLLHASHLVVSICCIQFVCMRKYAAIMQLT